MKQKKTAVTDAIEHINVLICGSYEGWTDDEKKGYLTACISIKENLIGKGLPQEREQMEDMAVEGFNEGCKMMEYECAIIHINNSKTIFDQTYTQEYGTETK